MNFNNFMQEILVKRRYLLMNDSKHDSKKVAHYNAYLLSNFGIVVNKPLSLTSKMLRKIAKVYKLYVPKSYFSNPQNMKYYTKDELFIEQVISYFFAYGNNDSHIKIFEKNLPEYMVGEELVLREFKIITKEEADDIFSNIFKDYCFYTRPWSFDEYSEVLALFKAGYYKDYEICCGDNAVKLLDFDSRFARFMFKKDLVKYSISKCGESSKIKLTRKTANIIKNALPFVKDCPMSKKQAKYFNTLIKHTKVDLPLETNDKSPYKLANRAIFKGDILEAAKIYASSGSLLERNLKMIISRADEKTAYEILKMVPSKNPLVLYQLVSSLSSDDGDSRTFNFFKNNLVKHHYETEYETKWRKSRLSERMRELVLNYGTELIIEGFKSQTSLGKVYIADNFYKVAMPINTSASGRGIDVYPTGTRLPIKGSYIRTFVHWKDAYDMDSSLVLVDEDGILEYLYFSNYSEKVFDDDILFSGDVTSPNGAEYFDIKLDAMKNRGYKYIIQTLYGYCSNLNVGEIHSGYQNKEDLETEAWDPKNIAMQIHVKGNTRAFVAFAIDLENKEIIVLNLLRNCCGQVVSGHDFYTIEKYLNPSILDFNIGRIVSCRGEVVNTPEEADVVFDDSYLEKENQIVIHSFETEKLVALINGSIIK